MSEYKVIVGNVGTVYSGGCRKEAMRAFNEYRNQSKDGYGRAAHEDVTLMQGDEILKEHHIDKLKGAPSIKELASLIKSLKLDISDDFRCSDDPDDDTPGIQITIGADQSGWSYQTGDNSYSGGAYGYSHWGIGYIYRNSNSREVAKEALEDLRSQLY